MIVLLVEDHRPLAQTTTSFLESEGYEVDYAADGLSALNIASNNSYDAIILDLMLPKLDGYSICRELRTQCKIDTPILMLTARDTLEDKLMGFEQGADDYLVKPFEQRELLARIKALIKRHRGEVSSKRLQVGELILDTGTMQAWRNSQELQLSPTGYRILRILMRESPNVVNRDSIEQELWGDAIPNSDVLRSHLYNLRKIVDMPFEQALIQTIKGVGFKLTQEQ